MKSITIGVTAAEVGATIAVTATHAREMNLRMTMTAADATNVKGRLARPGSTSTTVAGLGQSQTRRDTAADGSLHLHRIRPPRRRDRITAGSITGSGPTPKRRRRSERNHADPWKRTKSGRCRLDSPKPACLPPSNFQIPMPQWTI
jgi:hypothetical protein